MDQPAHIGDRREVLIGETYKAALGAASVSSLLQLLADMTHSDRAFWGWFDQGRRAGHIADYFNADRQLVERYNSELSAQDAWLNKTNYFQSEGLIWRGARIVPREELAKTEFHRRFLAPQAIGHTLHIVVSVKDGGVSHVMLTRNPHELDYSDQEIEIARCFAVHARRAQDAQRQVSRLRMVQSGLSDVIDNAALGVAILDPPELVYISETCENILSSLGAPPPRPGSVGTHSQPAAARIYFPRAVAEAVNNHTYNGATRLIINRPGSDRQLLVDIRPFVFQGFSRLEGRTGLAVTFCDLGQSISVDEELLQSAYELTAAEARICSLLVNGERVEELSERLNIRPNTARTHLKRIFGKTGSTRQAELVKLIMRTAKLRCHANGHGSRKGLVSRIRLRSQNGLRPRSPL